MIRHRSITSASVPMACRLPLSRASHESVHVRAALASSFRTLCGVQGRVLKAFLRGADEGFHTQVRSIQAQRISAVPHHQQPRSLQGQHQNLSSMHRTWHLSWLLQQLLQRGQHHRSQTAEQFCHLLQQPPLQIQHHRLQTAKPLQGHHHSSQIMQDRCYPTQEVLAQDRHHNSQTAACLALHSLQLHQLLPLPCRHPLRSSLLETGIHLVMQLPLGEGPCLQGSSLIRQRRGTPSA